MKITINQKNINFSATQIEKSEHTFSFLYGRKFSFKFKDQTWIKDVSLNYLIEAVKTAARKQEQDPNEIKAFLKLFNELRHEGYESPVLSIKKENFLIQILAKIKHFFAEKRRDKLLKELTQSIDNFSKSIPNNVSNVDHGALSLQMNSEMESEEVLDSCSFESLPQDLQVAVLRKLDYQSLLAFYKTNKKFKNLIEERLSDELKKACFDPAFQAWRNYFNDRIFFSRWTSVYQYDFSLPIIDKLAPIFSKEMILDLKEFFLFNKSNLIDISEFKNFIRIANLAFKSQPTQVIEVIKLAIQAMLLNSQEIQPGKELQLLECVKFLASVDLSSAVEYRNLLQSHLEILIERGFESTPQSLGMAFLETLAMIDLTTLTTYKNLLGFNRIEGNQHRKQIIFLNLLGTARPFEQIFGIVESVQNESLKWVGFSNLLKRYPKESLEAIHFIQMALETCQTDVIGNAAIAYARMRELEKAFEMIENLHDNLYEYNIALIEMAKIYAPLDQNKTLQILEKIHLSDFTLDDRLVEIVEIYVSIDIEKAKEVCNLIQAKNVKARALCLISNTQKNKDIVETNILWENILQIARQAYSYDVSEPYFSLLEVTCQKAEIEPNNVKQFLENKLRSFSNDTRKSLFMHALKTGKLGLDGSMQTQHFELLIKTYVKIDPIETQAWIKECIQQIPNLFLPIILMSLKENLYEVFKTKKI